MRIAICGAGIAGPTLAYWLLQYGHQPVLIERAPELRAGGYIIDFWGLGYSIAERMGILPEVLRLGYGVREVRFVGGSGRKEGGFSTDAFQRMTNGRFTSLPRSDLSAAIFGVVRERVETIFGTTITAVNAAEDAAEVTLSDGRHITCDLVIGAGGLHSPIRNLVFGPQQRYEVDLGYRAAAFEAEGYAARDDLAYVSHAEPGRQIARFTMRDGRTLFLFVFRKEMVAEAEATASPRDIIARVFADTGWEWPAIRAALMEAGDIYFDKVSQIRLPSWSQGRVALVGDAAACVSLLAGEGTGLAMIEAYVLAGELHAAKGDHAVAFARYEQRLRPLIEAKQKSAAAFASAFAPRTAFGIWFRNQVTRAFVVPGLADWVVGRDLRDDIELPDYAGGASSLGA